MKIFVLLLCCSASLAVQAHNSAPQPPLTEQWLTIQREGTHASPHPQTASVAEQELAHKRWLDSLSHEIPDQFEVDANAQGD